MTVAGRCATMHDIPPTLAQKKGEKNVSCLPSRFTLHVPFANTASSGLTSMTASVFACFHHRQARSRNLIALHPNQAGSYEQVSYTGPAVTLPCSESLLAVAGCTDCTSLAQKSAHILTGLFLMMLDICCGCYRRQLERANAEEEQAAAEALKQVQAEQQRDHDTNFHLQLQAEEIKVRTASPLPSL